jgi:hypothetical protein
MMSALLVLMLVLAVHSLTFAGAAEGLRFYLVPDFSAIDGGVIVAAMNQAFFSLSVGMGGMATVYKAYQPGMDRMVALKVLPQQYSKDKKFIERFEREARIIARLEHRNAFFKVSLFLAGLTSALFTAKGFIQFEGVGDSPFLPYHFFGNDCVATVLSICE